VRKGGKLKKISGPKRNLARSAYRILIEKFSENDHNIVKEMGEWN
jgi:hypothetical protein